MKIFWKNIPDGILDISRKEALKKRVGYKKGRSSISHSSGVWACAVDDQACGLDIESAQRADFHAIAKRYFSRAEQAYVSEGGLGAFLEIWTCKEAIAKLCQQSIFRTLSGVDLVKNDRLVKRYTYQGSDLYLYSKDDFLAMTLSIASRQPIFEKDIEFIEI